MTLSTTLVNTQLDQHKKGRSWKLIAVAGGTLLVIKAVVLPFLTPALRKICIPYLPATQGQIKNFAHLLKHCKGPLVDLGSGDGRLVLHAAKMGLVAHGIELNPWLILYSTIVKVYLKTFIRLTSQKSGNVFTDIRFYRKNLWNMPLSQYRTVVVFGVKEMMPRLKDKIIKELDQGSKVITCRFPLITRETDAKILPYKIDDLKLIFKIEDGIDSMWLYQKS